MERPAGEPPASPDGQHLAMLLGPGVGSFVVVSVLTGAPMVIGLALWGIWHARRSFRAASPDVSPA